jgi:acyl-CoA thioester hydrolase/1,4-dihydroxy-2-naphthoyl-CoA hydrolase
MSQNSEKSQVFQTKVKIRFRDADPAGIMFFGNILGLSHDVFEEFIAAQGVTWKEWFKPEHWSCPIRHAEVDYLSPFSPGQSYIAEVRVSKIGQSSFQMRYDFKKEDGTPCAKVQVVHTFVDKKTFQKSQVPEHFQKLFQKFLID